jgi:hypothetical protein
VISDDFGYIRICQAGVLGHDSCLVVLPIEDEGCTRHQQQPTFTWERDGSRLPFLGLGTFGSGWHKQIWLGESSDLANEPAVDIDGRFRVDRRSSSADT